MIKQPKPNSKIIPLPVQTGNLKGLIFENESKETTKPSNGNGFLFSFLIPVLLISILGLLLNLAVKPTLSNSQLSELETTKQELQRIKNCIK
jgi:hypothetical protein